MKALIIYANPKTSAHGPKILKEVRSNLDSKKAKFEILNLYQMKYDPVLKTDEHYTAGNYEVSKQNQAIQKKIRRAEYLIFIYPIWWYEMPAILKGFFDRVFTPRFSFIYKGKIPKGLLKNKAIVFYTSGGPTAFYRVMGNLPKKNIKDILKFNGIKPRVYPIGSARELTKKREKAIKKTVKKALEGI